MLGYLLHCLRVGLVGGCVDIHLIRVGNGRSDRLPCLAALGCYAQLPGMFEWRPCGKTSVR